MKRLWLPVAVGALAAGCSTDTPQPSPSSGDGNAALSPEVMAQIDSLILEKAARTPAQRKIASALLYAKSGQFDATMAETKDPAKRITSLQQVDDKGRYLLDVRGDMSAMGGRLEALGGSVVKLHRQTARVWLPLGQIETLAAEPKVQTIRPALLATTRRIDKPGSVKFRTASNAQRIAAVQAAQASLATTTAIASERPAADAKLTVPATTNIGVALSQGDKAHAADRARKFFGADGTGVNVGVLSDSDDFKEQAIASGDLPADTVTIPGEDGRPGGGEGTAMMEIVHDLAPGAKLFFASAFASPESFADNIRALRFQFHCDVIIDDVIYFFESPYQDDIVAQAVDDVTADGAMFFSSAGNEGNFDDGTSGTWEGDFKPAGALATLPSGYTVHSFGNNVIENRIEAGGGPLILHWSDPGTLTNPASSNDYDLFVLDNDLRNVAVAATDVQDGAGLPFEFLGFNIPPGFRVVIAAHPNAEPRAVHAVLFGGELALSTSGSVYGHNSAIDAFAVGAVDAAEGGSAGFIAGPTTPVELFSADGPRRIFFDNHNQPIDPAHPGLTFASRGGVARSKPDLSAADGVATTLPGGSGLNPFFGTSAAAPHAGAIAALLKSAMPTATPAKIRQAMLLGSLDIEGLGVDRNSGRGVVSAFNTLQRAGVAAAVSLAGGALRLTPLGTDVILPGSAAQVSVEITNGGGAPATAVSATLTSSSPNVIILQGTSAYPTIAAEGTALNTVPFAFFVDNATPCGAQLPFTLTVNYTGKGTHPIVVNFSLPTGRPGTTPAHFAYGGDTVAIPDASAAGVDIPVDIAGFTGAVAKVVFSLNGASCSSDIGATTVGVDHTWVGDLTFTLTSPGGKTVTLLSAAGGAGNNGNNFCQTVLDDSAATSIQAVTATQAPFTGTFRPAQPLSAFAGESGTGTWTLHASDSATLDTGSVRSFSLDISGFSCTR